MWTRCYSLILNLLSSFNASHPARPAELHVRTRRFSPARPPSLLHAYYMLITCQYAVGTLKLSYSIAHEVWPSCGAAGGERPTGPGEQVLQGFKRRREKVRQVDSSRVMWRRRKIHFLFLIIGVSWLLAVSLTGKRAIISYYQLITHLHSLIFADIHLTVVTHSWLCRGILLYDLKLLPGVPGSVLGSVPGSIKPVVVWSCNSSLIAEFFQQVFAAQVELLLINPPHSIF